MQIVAQNHLILRVTTRTELECSAAVDGCNEGGNGFIDELRRHGFNVQRHDIGRLRATIVAATYVWVPPCRVVCLFVVEGSVVRGAVGVEACRVALLVCCTADGAGDICHE